MTDASKPTSPTSKKTRKKALGIFFFLLILMVILAGLYWFYFIKDYQTTEDAYVSGNQVMISSQIAGNVRQINVENMDFVRAGEVLLELDDTDYQLSFSQAQNTLASAVRQMSQLGYTVKQLEATVQANQTALTKAQGDLARREQLGKSGAIDKESLQHAREAVMTAEANLNAVKNQLAANKSLLMNVPLKAQPETQLKDMRIGQPVKLSFDLYGHDVKFDGKVEGIEMGTGSAFSLLPAQNATGNWIKVVQRVPVRISLDAQQIANYPLRIGLSTLVEVNISDTRGEMLSQQKRTEPLYSTNTLNYDQSAVENLIEKIIRDNTN